MYGTFGKTLLLACTIASVLILSGCGTSQDTTGTGDTRQVLYISTQLIGQTDSKGSITKSAKILGVSDITITSQVAGRVTSIPGELGDTVGPSTSLVRLTDTNGTIAFGVQRNQLAVETANNTYAIQKANLEKQIEDSQIALRRAQLNLDVSKSDADKQLEKLDYDLANANAALSGSSTQLQIQKLEKDLQRAQYDYQMKLDADAQTISNFITTAGNLYNDVSNLMTDVVTESDKILGVSAEFEYYNDPYEVYLGARNTETVTKARLTLEKLIRLQDGLDDLGDTTIGTGNIVSYVQSYSEILATINELNNSMKDVLIATVPSSNLNQAGIDGLIASYNGLVSRSSAIIGSSSAQINAISTFIVTYQQSQSSLAQQVSILEDQIALTKKSLEDATFTTQLGADRTRTSLDAGVQNSQLALDSTKLATDFAVDTKDLNLESIQNQLRSAQIALSELNFNAAKLNISSPIRGIVSDILVDVGQDVMPGTPVARVVSDQQELEITLTESEKGYIELGQKVEVSNQNQQTYGTVSSVSKTADRNGNFIVKIAIDDSLFDVGVFVDVQIPLQAGNAVVPVNAVTIVDTNLGQITLWDGNTLINKTVGLGSLFGEMIEVTDKLEPGMMLVTSDISNYDPNKQKIELKKVEKKVNNKIEKKAEDKTEKNVEKTMPEKTDNQ